MRRWALASIAALAAGCGDSGVTGKAGSSGNAAAVDPALSAEAAPSPPSSNESAARPPDEDETAMRWHFSRSPAGARLVFGEPQTDNVRLMLRCPPGGDSVLLTFHRPRETVEARPGELEIRSGGASLRSAIDASESQLGGMLVEAQAPVTAEPFRQMQSGRPLELRWGDETISVPGSGSGEVALFFRTCGPF